MNTFDERMRARAHTEDCPVPAGFEHRLSAALEELPAGKANIAGRSRRLRRGLIAAAIAAALCAGGVAASPAVLTMIAEAVDQSEIPAEFRRLSEEIEPQPFSAAVGASVTDQGYTLTVEHIAVDDAFVTLYYTVTGEASIPVRDGKPEIWSLRLMADGDYLEFWRSDIETELVDGSTLRVIQRSPVLRALPDVVELEVYSDELIWGVFGSWHLSLSVDKSAPAAESLVAEPRQSFRMMGHKVTADKVVVAPSGGGLVLTEAGEGPPLTQFILMDDQGTVLPHKRYGTVSRPILPVSNFVEFYGGRTDMTSITIVPWQWSGEDGESGGNHEVFGALDSLPLTDGHAEQGYTLLSLEIGPSEAVGVFQTGDAWRELGYSGYGAEFTLLDGTGAPVELGETRLERAYDMETGLWTVTISYPDAAEEQSAQTAGVSFSQPNGTIELLEDQAVTIDFE